MRTKPFRLLWVVLLSLSGVLPAAATDYEVSDYLPLAVGNSWTYYHDYYDGGNIDVYSQWPNYSIEFTLSVLRTEVIDGHTYFVISDMPEGWPPVSRQFIAGKKLRWAGDHLMERTADGEQALFRFDATSGPSEEDGYYYDLAVHGGILQVPAREIRSTYDLAVHGETIQVTAREIRSNTAHNYEFIFSGGAGPVRIYPPYNAIDYGDLDATGELERPRPDFGAVVTFLKDFGVQFCNISLYDDDVLLFCNDQDARHAEINGRTVTVQEAREESVAQLEASDATHTESNSWGAIKQEESK